MADASDVEVQISRSGSGSLRADLKRGSLNKPLGIEADQIVNAAVRTSVSHTDMSRSRHSISGPVTPTPASAVDAVDTNTPPTPEQLDEIDRKPWNPPWDKMKAGLTSKVAAERLEVYGRNALPESKSNPLLDYLRNFWGPMPIMIWTAIIILGLKSSMTKKTSWPDFVMCCVLQFVNGNVKWYNTKNARAALDALKAKMAPQSHCKRDGDWKKVNAAELVPGDVIQIDIGSIIPADARMGTGKNIQLDQSALTGESLPKSINNRDMLYSSAIVRCGDGEAVVVSTGLRTEMGKAAKLVASVKKKTRYDRVLFFVAVYLLVMALTLMVIQFACMIAWGEDVLYALGVVVAILIGALPIAMHVVCMVIMAMGAQRLSEKSAVVSELTATEELSGMQILCSDKTGTLTYNRLEIIEAQTEAYDCSYDELIFYSAISCNRKSSGQDAIDYCITNVCKAIPEMWAKMDSHPQAEFVPFDPEIKRTEAIIGGDGNGMQVCKGAPQVILNLSENRDKIREQVEGKIMRLAKGGYRALGVATAPSGGEWEFRGVLAIADPPRKDTAQVVQHAKELGIKVIMITGDQLAIAREVGKATGIGENMLPTHFINDFHQAKLSKRAMTNFLNLLERCDGFAEVLPEHKFQIVRWLQDKGYIVGMTGDGVNDAPALRAANVGIAVSGATDAARAAAAMFLQEEGLSVIIDAIMRSKKVFERVKAYIIYRSATSLRLMGFFFCCTMFITPEDWLPGDVMSHGYREGCKPWDTMAEFPEHEACVSCYGMAGTAPYPPELANCMADFATTLTEAGGEEKTLEVMIDRSRTSTGTVLNIWSDLCADAFDAKGAQDDCMWRLIRSDLHISSYFQTPTMVVIVLTVLNDFTVITIAFDHVQISTSPNSWWMWRNVGLGSIVGFNTLIWSMVAFIFLLDSLRPDSSQCQTYGVCLDYTQVLTGAFLQLSLSARLARTNTRKMAAWFWTSALYRAVVMTMSFSVTAAILLGFTWPFCGGEGLHDQSCHPHMSPLHPLVCCFILLWQIPVHVFRDICYNQLFTYFLNSDVTRQEAQRKKHDEEDAVCLAIMRDELNLAITEAKGVREQRPVAVRTEHDQGGWIGPPMMVWAEGSKNCRCNALGFFVLYGSIALVGILVYATS